MDDIIRTLRTPKECEILAKNALERGREDIAIQAKRRAIELKADEFDAESDAEKEAFQAVVAYEEVLSRKNGKRTRATHTRQMINRHGVIEAVERVVNRPDDAAGYTVLVEMGFEEFAFETVVVNHPDLFSAKALDQAKSRLASWQSDS